MGKRNVEDMMRQGFIEVLPLAFARGLNVDNSILIAEEFQNATVRQTKTLLTRIGWKSKFFISGDLEQSDRYKNSKETGLYDAITRLDDVPEIGIFKFGIEDVVRNNLVGKILNKYKDE